jgi:hypothetical protein
MPVVIAWEWSGGLFVIFLNFFNKRVVFLLQRSGDWCCLAGVVVLGRNLPGTNDTGSRPCKSRSGSRAAGYALETIKTLARCRAWVRSSRDVLRDRLPENASMGCTHVRKLERRTNSIVLVI